MKSAPTIAIIDHGAGNLVSMAQGLRTQGAHVRVAETPDAVGVADGVVLPGVGATGAAMARLSRSGFDRWLRSWEGPLLGVCVGMQLFFDASDEDGGECLGLIRGRVIRLISTPRLPHIGWNDVAFDSDPLFSGLPTGTSFYFVHSFAPAPTEDDIVIGRTEYGMPFASAVRSGLRVGVQFHPERSGEAGLAVLGNFVRSCTDARNAA